MGDFFMKLLSLLGQASGDFDPSMYDSTYNYNTTQPLSNEAAAGITIGIILVSLFIALVAYVLSAFFLSRIFKKAGVEPWKAWVPIYNTWILLELGDQKGFWAVLMIIPLVNIVATVFMIIAEYNIGLKFGKESWFVLLAIFIPIVWLIWLAFDDSTWKGAKKVVDGTTTPPTNTTPPAAPTPPTTPVA
jgi:uncharacterized membrane protein